MIIFGIDPGYAIVGYGVIDYLSDNTFHVAAYGAITTEAGMPFEQRLVKVYDDLNYVIARTKPDVLAIEKLFFTVGIFTENSGGTVSVHVPFRTDFICNHRG